MLEGKGPPPFMDCVLMPPPLYIEGPLLLLMYIGCTPPGTPPCKLLM
jgi:hypothetical protein